jgi:N-acetylmuramoyl-L-alanine amidase
VRIWLGGTAVAVSVSVALGVSACGGSGGDAGLPSPSPASRQATRPSGSASGSASGSTAATPELPLAGKVVGVDPGHNGGNFADPSFIDHLIWNGREWETCNTTGTETDGGYTEARFNFSVATFLRADLTSEGARVVMTRTSNDGVGPCVNERAAIMDRAHADVAIAIHADGGPPSGRGFAVLEPVADGPNDKVIKASVRFGDDVRSAFLKDTTMPVSSYDGTDGITFRDNLAGLNLTSVPEVFIECGNMRNATDAALLISTGYQQRIARALAAAITQFLGG